MNWKEISEKYPKAYFNELLESDIYSASDFYSSPKPKGQLLVDYAPIRNLYDFFDEQEIWIEISADRINGWMFEMFKLTEDYWSVLFSAKFTYKTRIEAETAAFIKAFELLEEKLRSEER